MVVAVAESTALVRELPTPPAADEAEETTEPALLVALAMADDPLSPN